MTAAVRPSGATSPSVDGHGVSDTGEPGSALLTPLAALITTSWHGPLSQFMPSHVVGPTATSCAPTGRSIAGRTSYSRAWLVISTSMTPPAPSATNQNG